MNGQLKNIYDESIQSEYLKKYFTDDEIKKYNLKDIDSKMINIKNCIGYKIKTDKEYYVVKTFDYNKLKHKNTIRDGKHNWRDTIIYKYKYRLFPDRNILQTIYYEPFKNNNQVYLVEGFFDYVKLKRFTENVICLFSPSVSEKKLQQIIQFNFKKIIIFFDNDIVGFLESSSLHSKLLKHTESINITPNKKLQTSIYKERDDLVKSVLV